MQTVTSKKGPATWPVIVGLLAIAGILAITTTLDRPTSEEGVTVPAPVTVTFAIPQLDGQPVPGMPRDTFESINGTGSEFVQPMGMPNYTWQEIGG